MACGILGLGVVDWMPRFSAMSHLVLQLVSKLNPVSGGVYFLRGSWEAQRLASLVYIAVNAWTGHWLQVDSEDLDLRLSLTSTHAVWHVHWYWYT